MKNKRNRIAVLLLVFVLAVGFAACGGAGEGGNSNDGQTGDGNRDSGGVKVFKVGHVNAGDPDDHYHYFCDRLNDHLMEICDGKIQFDIYSDSLLGTEVEMFSNLSNGTLDAAIMSTCAISGTLTELQLFDLPYMFESEEEYQYLLDHEEFMRPILDIFENDWNVHAFASACDASYRMILGTGKPIESVNDMKDLKIRITANRVHEDTFKALGTIATVVAWGETYTAFQQGVIDAMDVGLPIGKVMGFYEVGDYWTHMKSHPILGYPLMSKAVWDNLTEEEQDWIEEAAALALAEQRTHQREIEERFAAQMIEETGILFSSPDLAPFKEATAFIHEKYRAEIGSDLLDEAYRVLEEYRQERL